MKQRTLTVKLLLRILPAAMFAGTATMMKAAGKTATPIQHLVVIFQENVSFDHYFGTYPYATNPSGQPAFHARPGTPTVRSRLSGRAARSSSCMTIPMDGMTT
jgi:phospholipase C